MREIFCYIHTQSFLREETKRLKYARPKISKIKNPVCFIRTIVPRHAPQSGNNERFTKKKKKTHGKKEETIG